MNCHTIKLTFKNPLENVDTQLSFTHYAHSTHTVHAVHTRYTRGTPAAHSSTHVVHTQHIHSTRGTHVVHTWYTHSTHPLHLQHTPVHTLCRIHTSLTLQSIPSQKNCLHGCLKSANKHYHHKTLTLTDQKAPSVSQRPSGPCQHRADTQPSLGDAALTSRL